MKPFQILVVLATLAMLVQLWSDTVANVPLRGTNTSGGTIEHFSDGTFIDKSVHPSQRYRLFNSITNRQPQFPPDGTNVYHGSQPPPLPLDLARLIWLTDDLYTLKCGKEDVIALDLNAQDVKPIVRRGKNGRWQLVFVPLAP